MALVAFGPWQVGFWVVARGIAARAELPAEVTVRTSGEPADDRRALVVAAADGEGRVGWGAILHDDGASVLLSWKDRLFAAMGARAVALEQDGSFVAERLFPSPILGAWTVADGLFLLGPDRVTRVDARLSTQWERPLEGDSFHVLSADEARLSLVAMNSSGDWRPVELDASSGETIAP